MKKIIILLSLILVINTNADSATTDTTLSINTSNTIVSKLNIIQAVAYFEYIGSADIDYKKFRDDTEGIKSLLGTNLFTVYHPQAKYINKFGVDITVDPDNFTRLWGIAPKIEVNAVSKLLSNLADIIKVPILEQGLDYLANNGVYTAGINITHDFHYSIITDWKKGNYIAGYFSYGQFPKSNTDK